MTTLAPLRLDVALAPWRAVFEEGLASASLGGGSAENLRPPVVVACSGGADSIALLAFATATGLDPVAVHVDHGIRPGSVIEGGVVVNIAERLGCRHHLARVTVGPGPSIEARARELRYLALETARVELGASAILTGHTEDDQAETVLLHLLRGAASAGLGGMPSHRGRLVRPLLGLGHAVTVEICARLSLVPLHDPMNDDTSLRRVWLRREVLPLLEVGARRDLRRVLARQASVLRAESDYLDGLADALLATAGAPPAAAVIAGAPPPLARRAVRRWLGPPPPSLDEVDAVIEVARNTRHSANLVGGDRVVCSGGSLLREIFRGLPRVRQGGMSVPQPVVVPFPGTAEGLGVRVESWVERAAPTHWPDGRNVCVLDAAVVGAEGWLRLPSPGERCTPFGLTGSKAVREVLAEARVPAAERSGRPILTDAAGRPLWVLGYRVDHRARVTPRTRRYLWISCERGEREGWESS